MAATKKKKELVRVITSAKNGGSNTNVVTSHLHSSLPITGHTHAQLKGSNFGVLGHKLVAQLRELLYIMS